MTRFRLLLGAAGVVFACMTGVAHAAAWSAHGSVEQVYVTGVTPNTGVSLLDSNGQKIKGKLADSLGSVLFRGVAPGTGYKVRLAGGAGESGPLTVLTTNPTPPSTSIYDQSIPAHGYGYLTTRDGTKLAYDIHPPSDVSQVLPTGYLPFVPTGPKPTLIEYSGYGYANPAGPQSGIAILANIMGFTVVDVNMRGTGCSGGAFDFFEPLQSLDGYDVIETIARQPWVAHHKVGMMGISYGGISQLFTGQTQPPSLAALSPLSLIDQTQTTLYPGGILNTGFAVAWAQERQNEAQPAGPNAGQRWAYDKIQAGDQVCKDNQALHGQAADLMGKIRDNDHYKPAVADPLAPITFVDKINVPSYVVCQWEDEQTGGHCPTLAEHWTGTSKKWFTFTNGTHVDSLDPATYERWYDFLSIYVARKPPIQNAALVNASAPLVYQQAMGMKGAVTLPPDPVQAQPTLALAQAEFEKQPSIRVLFDNGAGGNDPGEPLPGFEQSFASFPVPGTTARTWFFGDGGALTNAAPTAAGADEFTWDAHARNLTNFTGDTGSGTDGLWTATPPYNWQNPPAGSAVSYVSNPLTANTTVIGAGAVRAWIKSTSPNVDLQATVSEIRPDGKEVFVQNGWLRANERKLDPAKSTPLEPVLSLRAKDVSPVPSDQFVEATIPLYYQGHAYRAGSRIRVTISAPNGDQPIWSFGETQPTSGNPIVTFAHSPANPSSLTLPVVPGVAVPTDLPPCPGLRAEPCRPYVALANRPAA